MPRNPYLCLVIVSVLGAFCIVGMIGILLLPLAGHEAPREVLTLVGGAIGSLASFMVQVPRGSVGGGSLTEHVQPPLAAVPAPAAPAVPGGAAVSIHT